jgi:hypothetical protein
MRNIASIQYSGLRLSLWTLSPLWPPSKKRKYALNFLHVRQLLVSVAVKIVIQKFLPQVLLSRLVLPFNLVTFLYCAGSFTTRFPSSSLYPWFITFEIVHFPGVYVLFPEVIRVCRVAICLFVTMLLLYSSVIFSRLDKVNLRPFLWDLPR